MWATKRSWSAGPVCAQLLWLWQVLLGLTASRRELRRGGGEHVASDACTTEVLMQLRVCFFLSFTLSRTLSLSPSLTLFAILLSCCASFNKCTKRMTTSASGAGLPAVTAKNYMPCAKVLPLHYSNIKSSRSSKSTRVAVCNFSLPSPPPPYPLQSVKRGWQKTSWIAHAASRSLPRRAKKLYAAF